MQRAACDVVLAGSCPLPPCRFSQTRCRHIRCWRRYRLKRATSDINMHNEACNMQQQILLAAMQSDPCQTYSLAGADAPVCAFHLQPRARQTTWRGPHSMEPATCHAMLHDNRHATRNMQAGTRLPRLRRPAAQRRARRRGRGRRGSPGLRRVSGATLQGSMQGSMQRATRNKRRRLCITARIGQPDACRAQ